MPDTHDIAVLRPLAEQYVAIARKDIQEERRELWRAHNSLEDTPPLILVMAGAAWQEIIGAQIECQDPFYQGFEHRFRDAIFNDTVGHDAIVEPWVTATAVYRTVGTGAWGAHPNRKPPPVPGGAWKDDPPIKRLEDIDKLVAPHHLIDEEATARNLARLQEAFGDIVPVNLDRAPLYRVWNADLSSDLAYLRGLDQVMLDMVDNPGWLHEVLSFMRDGVLRVHEEAEQAGDWHLADHYNQAMPYSRELADPRANGESVTRGKLWGYLAAQELTLVSPRMHDEFMLQYQIPILEKFGLSAYGCCENLTEKIDILRQIPNLRRIAVTPTANIARCAEQIGHDYVLAWRPNPAEMICCGFDPERVTRIIREGLAACRGCVVDITLKDVQTTLGKPELLREWVKVVRGVAEEFA
jgi:hypothetical protein